MNRLAPAPDTATDATDAGAASEAYLLPKHAHIVVYEREVAATDATHARTGAPTSETDGEATHRAGRQLVTIYDCGAAQKPPSAQLLGTLGSVRARCETTQNPTGYVVSMREPAVLVDEGDGHYVVRPR